MLVYALTQRRSTSSLKNVVPPQRVQNSRSSAKQRKSFGEDIVKTKSFDVASERLARTTIVYVSHQLWIDAAIRADSTQSRFVDDGANDVVSEAVGVRQGDRGGADRCPLPGAEDSDGDPVDLHVLVDQGGDLTLNPCGLLVEGLTAGDDHGDLRPVVALGVDEAGVLARLLQRLGAWGGLTAAPPIEMRNPISVIGRAASDGRRWLPARIPSRSRRRGRGRR